MNDKMTPLEIISAINVDNQRRVTTNARVIKAAIREIEAHVKINGEGVMTRCVLNALRNCLH